MEPEVLQHLLRRVVAGDDAAWQEFWSALDPELSRCITNLRSLGPLQGSEDDRRTIALKVMDRLRADDFRRLKGFLAQAEERHRSDFGKWLFRVASNVALDHLRADPELLAGRGHQTTQDDEPGWIDLVSVDLHDPSFRPPFTNLVAGKRLLEVAEQVLDDEQLLGLRYWLWGSTFEEIGALMDLRTPKSAERLVRAALQRLRREVAEQKT